MPQPKDFLYFLTDQNGKSYRVNNGLVEAVAAPTPLRNTPDGWQEKTIKYTRNTKWWGVFRSFTLPLKFVKDGAHIIRDRMIKSGTEDKLYLIILWLDKSYGGGWIHRSFYKGEIDLSNCEVDEDSEFVTANVMEGDLMKFIKANENTTYELPIDVPEAINILCDGITLKQKASYILTNGTLNDDLGGHSLSLQFFSTEALSSIGSVTQDRVKSSNSASVLWANNNFVMTTGENPTTVTINWKFRVYLTLATGVGAIFGTKYFLQLLSLESSSAQTATVLQEIGGGDPLLIYNRWNTFEGSATVTIPANRKLVIYMSASVNRDFTFFTYDNEGGTFDIQYTYRQKRSFVKALRPAYVAQQLLNKMTGSTNYTFESEYLTTVWENLVITGGNTVRGIKNGVLKLSWSDFFDSYNVPCNIEMGIGGMTMTIEKKAEAFRSNVMLEMGDVKELKHRFATDYLFSNLKIGYPDQNYENVNGKFEFNTTQTWVTPIKKVNRSFELLSKFRADAYGFEFARIEGAGKDTTDLKSDNDVFFVHVEKSATAGTGTEPALYYKFLRNAYTITGLQAPADVWNVELSPKRCLLAHGNVLHGVFWWQNGENLQFQSALKDTAMKTVDGSGNVVEERADIFIGNLPAPLYLPYEFRAVGKITKGMIQTVETDGLGTVSFVWDGITFYGFITDIGFQPSQKGEQETTLLCSPVTDLTKLIH